jgi:hypothetical protein
MAWNLIWEAELDFCQARLGYAKTIGLPITTTSYIPYIYTTYYHRVGYGTTSFP